MEEIQPDGSSSASALGNSSAGPRLARFGNTAGVMAEWRNVVAWGSFREGWP